MQPQDLHSGNMLTTNFILEFTELDKDQICFTKDDQLLSNWEKSYARITLKACCEHNVHYNVDFCCDSLEGSCEE